MPPPSTIDYRSPSTGSHTVQRVMRELETAETLGAAWVGVKLVAGIVLCLLPPLIAAVVVKRIEWRFRGDFLPGFEATFLLAAAVIVPLLMRLERRRVTLFDESAWHGMTPESSGYDFSAAEGFRRRNPTLEWRVYADLALAGPRLLWSVIDSLGGKVTVDPSLRMAAAEIALELFEAGESRALRQLVNANRPPPMVSAAVHYLLRCDWACLSARRDRVCLSTLAQRRLARL